MAIFNSFLLTFTRAKYPHFWAVWCNRTVYPIISWTKGPNPGPFDGWFDPATSELMHLWLAFIVDLPMNIVIFHSYLRVWLVVDLPL